MKNIIKKNFNSIFFILISLLILSFSFFQSISQHWSSVKDFDLTVIFNSLQVISGNYQDFREHPGYTQFIIYGSFFKFFSFFDSELITNVDSFVNLYNPENNLQKLFLIARFANSVCLVILIVFFYRICTIFDIERTLIYFSIISLLITDSFLSNLTILRADLVAVSFFLISFFYLMSFTKEKQKIIKIFISSFFMILALLAKIQIIIMLIFILFFFPIFYKFQNNKNENIYDINKNFKSYIILYFILIFSFIVLQIFIHQHPRFVDQNYLDLIVFIIFNFFYFFYLYLISKKNFDLFKFNFSIFVLFIIGIILSIVFLNILSYLNIFKLSPYILLRLSNPFYYLKVYSPISNLNVDLEFLKNLATTTLDGFKINIINIALLIIILFFSLFKDIQKNNNAHINYKIIFFLSFLLIILSFNFRYYLLYDIYYLPVYYLLICLCIKNFSKGLIYPIFIFFLLINNNFLLTKKSNFEEYFSREHKLNHICLTYETRHFYWWWARKLDESFFKNLCLKQNLKFVYN